MIQQTPIYICIQTPTRTPTCRHTHAMRLEREESEILYGLSQCQKQVYGERVLLCTASENCGKLAKHMVT